jgi:DMSO/TMAO reductase YedYZ molybdopterin-dependent catalytic subunit
MTNNSKAGLTRRELLSTSLLAGGVWLTGAESLLLAAQALRGQQDPFAGGTMLGTVDFIGESPVPIPMEKPLGSELDGRLFTDLGALSLAAATVPTEKFYVRTRASQLLDLSNPWAIQSHGPTPSGARNQFSLSMPSLMKMAAPRGVHLMECAGNTREGHFGLLSAANWSGVEISALREIIPGAKELPRLLVSGFDSYAGPSRSSEPGASWIFTWYDLIAAKAFLATQMNGQPLTADHGAPARLVVPGWYGCSCIKWVNEITPVADELEATSQMREFAFRTHQQGTPQLARDFAPAIIDAAAMPIRVEKWRVPGKTKYRVVGILWGGSERVKSLAIQFNANDEFLSVENIIATKEGSWSFWTQTWVPPQAGVYVMKLKVTEPQVRTRRLDMGFYTRTVEIKDL